MKVVGGDLPKKDGYSVGGGEIRYLFKSWIVSKRTVSNITPVNAQKTTNYGDVGFGMATGALLAGPLGMIAGGLLGGTPRGSMLFMIDFKDGKKALCLGTNAEFNKALAMSMK